MTCWKLPFSSEHEAMHKARCIASRKGNDNCQRAYHCHHCGKWHLTRRGRQEFKRLTEIGHAH
jgi:hypothetical protein